jgi:hypothetical protein
VHLSRSVERIFALDRLARETSGAGAAMIVSTFAQTRPRPARHVALGLARDAPERAQGLARSEPAIAGPFKRRDRTR